MPSVSYYGAADGFRVQQMGAGAKTDCSTFGVTTTKGSTSMSASRHLSNKLRETLGREAGEELMTWLDEERSRRDTLAADVAELRQEMQVGFARLGADVTAQMHALDKRLLETKADLMKWSLVFWVGAVGAIAALAGLLR